MNYIIYKTAKRRFLSSNLYKLVIFSDIFHQKLVIVGDKVYL